MKEIVVTRKWVSDDSVGGTLELVGIKSWFSLEPKKAPQVKPYCIPEGTYQFHIARSHRLSLEAGHDYWCPHLEDVPGFEEILIHTGNFPQETKGCILIGQEFEKEALDAKAKVVHGAVFDSRSAFAELMQDLGGEKGTVTVRWLIN